MVMPREASASLSAMMSKIYALESAERVRHGRALARAQHWPPQVLLRIVAVTIRAMGCSARPLCVEAEHCVYGSSDTLL